MIIITLITLPRFFFIHFGPIARKYFQILQKYSKSGNKTMFWKKVIISEDSYIQQMDRNVINRDLSLKKFHTPQNGVTIRSSVTQSVDAGTRNAEFEPSPRDSDLCLNPMVL